MVLSQSCIWGLINIRSISLVGIASSSSRTLWVSESFQTLFHYMTSSISLKSRKLSSSNIIALLPNPHGVWETVQFSHFTQKCTTTQSIQSLGNYPIYPIHTELCYYPIHTNSRLASSHIIVLLPNPYRICVTNVHEVTTRYFHTL
jgi:hypothetical protein